MNKSNEIDLLSVIIPFHSQLKGLLEKSVLSALNQSYKNIEVIVVDDCSPLEASEELKNICDSRLVLIRNEVNLNGAISRNIGVSKATGKYVAFLDYDDIWYPSKLEDQYKLAQEYSHDKVVIYTKSNVIIGNRSFIRPRKAILPNEKVCDYIFLKNEIIQTSGIFMLRTSAVDNPFHDLKRHQDYQFCLTLEEKGYKFILLDKLSYEFIQVAKKNNYNFSAEWLERYSYLLSDKAILGFKKNVILKSMLLHHQEYRNSFMYSIKNGIPFFLLTLIVKLFVKKVI